MSFAVVLLAVAGLAIAQAVGGQIRVTNAGATGSTLTRTPTTRTPASPLLRAMARSLASGLHPGPLPRQVITAPRNLTVIPGPTTCEVAAAGVLVAPLPVLCDSAGHPIGLRALRGRRPAGRELPTL
jgi:hypothetical protein